MSSSTPPPARVSGIPPRLVAMTGMPLAVASISKRPAASNQNEGMSRMRVCRYTSRRSLWQGSSVTCFSVDCGRPIRSMATAMRARLSTTRNLIVGQSLRARCTSFRNSVTPFSGMGFTNATKSLLRGATSSGCGSTKSPMFTLPSPKRCWYKDAVLPEFASTRSTDSKLLRRL